MSCLHLLCVVAIGVGNRTKVVDNGNTKLVFEKLSIPNFISLFFFK